MFTSNTQSFPMRQQVFDRHSFRGLPRRVTAHLPQQPPQHQGLGISRWDVFSVSHTAPFRGCACFPPYTSQGKEDAQKKLNPRITPHRTGRISQSSIPVYVYTCVCVSHLPPQYCTPCNSNTSTQRLLSVEGWTIGWWRHHGNHSSKN